MGMSGAEIGKTSRWLCTSRMSEAAKRYERSLAVPGSMVNVSERTFERKSSSGVGAAGV